MKKSFSFAVIASVLLLPVVTLAAFSDTNGHVYAPSIDYVKAQGIVSGHPDGTYKPNDFITRAAFTKIVIEARFSDLDIELCLQEGEFNVSDVPLDAWFAKYFCVAKWSGVMSGYPDGTFGPGNNINLAEASKIIIKAYGIEVGSDPVWYVPFVNAITEFGAMPPTVTSPDQKLTRGEMAYMIHKLDMGLEGNLPPLDDDIVEVPKCVVAGCSSELCVEEGTDVVSDCAWKEMYACYEGATCERQLGSGECGWTVTETIKECLSKTSEEEQTLYDGIYAPFSESVLENGETSVLFFHAPWCPKCQANDGLLMDKLGTTGLPLDVYKIDYDTNPDLRAKFGVVTQDTFVLIDGLGSILDVINFPSEEKLMALLGF